MEQRAIVSAHPRFQRIERSWMEDWGATRGSWLASDARKWLNALGKHVAEEGGTLQRADCLPAHLVLLFTYNAKPDVAERILRIIEEGKFRYLLVLSFVQPHRREDWHKSLSEPLVGVTRQPHSALVIPNEGSMLQVSDRIELSGLQKFGDRELRSLASKLVKVASHQQRTHEERRTEITPPPSPPT